MFEQFPGYQKAGALLGLAPNTQKALHAIDPALLEAAAAASVPDGRSISFDHEGQQQSSCIILQQRDRGGAGCSGHCGA